MEVREPYVAGMFYPKEKEELERMIQTLIDSVEIKGSIGNIRGMICPHAGYIYSGITAAYSYKTAIGAGKRRAVVMGPSHYLAFQGAIQFGRGVWKSPLGKTRTYALESIPASPEAHKFEHSIETQLPFIQKTMGKEAEICPILFGSAYYKEWAEIIESQIEEKDIVIASSDLSHYLKYNEARMTDITTAEAIRNLDIEAFYTKGEACGKVPIMVLMEIARKNRWRAKMLDLRNSGDTAGGKDRVVGYLSCVFSED